MKKDIMGHALEGSRILPQTTIKKAAPERKILLFTK
jgi:hypothetical protein